MSDSKAPGADQAPKLDWSQHLPVHPAANIFPLMRETDPAGFAALVEDIRTNGLQTSIVLFVENGKEKVLDGRNRLDVLAHLDRLYIDGGRVRLDRHPGDAWHTFTYRHERTAEVTVGCDPYAFVLSANVHRRHLNAEQKRGLIAKLLKAKPEASSNSIAKQAKVDNKTVNSVRDELEANSEIPNKTDRVEPNGRKARGESRRLSGPRSRSRQRRSRAASSTSATRRNPMSVALKIQR